MLRKSILAAVFAGLFLQAGLAFAGGHSVAEDEVDQLQPYFMKEDLDLSGYDKVLIDLLEVNYARVVPPPWVEGKDRSPKKWKLTKKDEEFLRKSYRDAMREQIQEQGAYTITEEPGEGVLILNVSIIALTPYARKDEKVMVKGFGELLTQAQLRDGMTGELLGIFEGKQQVGSQYQQNSRLNAENNLKALFDIWGARVRGMLDSSR